jgi:hypothetical protein
MNHDRFTLPTVCCLLLLPVLWFVAPVRPGAVTPLNPTATPTSQSFLPLLSDGLGIEDARYVATNGSDNNPGTLASPWQTIGKAAATLIAGQTVYIRDGVYYETVRFSRSGTATQPIAIRAYPGEAPIIDGNNHQLPTGTWDALLELSGDYIQVSGLEVRFSNWIGVSLTGQHDTARAINTHDNMEDGLIAYGDYSTIEYCRVWRNAYRNEPNSTPYRDGGWAAALTAARDMKDGLTSHAILRGNVSYNNYGEGLSTFESDGTIIEDNVVYDNFTNMYISDATNVLAQRNLVYCTADSAMGTYGSQAGIMMGDEVYRPPSANNTVVNNFVYGCNRNFFWWQGSEGGGLQNALIANNTFVNARADAEANFLINSGSHSGSRIYNNIIEQDDAVTVAGVDTAIGLTFANNLWSKTPPHNAVGPDDIVGNPQLAKSGLVSPGGLTGEFFKLLAASPARDQALPLAEVADDYFRNPRDNAPDMGGDEFVTPQGWWTLWPRPGSMTPSTGFPRYP